MENHSDPANSSVKPAYKSTEFWLSILALVVGYVLTSGILDSEDATQAKIMKGLVAVAGILGALGAGAAPAAVALLKAAGVSVPTPPASS